MRVSMLLLASGRGERLGADVPKAFVRCAGRPLLLHCLDRLAAITDQREIVLAVADEHRRVHVEPLLSELRRHGVDHVVDGGSTRQESMRRALSASSSDHPLVLVHDAARPFFPVDAARRALARAAECGAALLAIPAADTLKRVGPDGRVTATLDRRGVWLAQTPQVARRELLERAIDLAARHGFDATDEASLLEHAGIPVEVVASCPTNFKVTTRADLELATAWATSESKR